MISLEKPKVFEDGSPRAENVLEDGLRPAQSLDLMRTGLRPLVVSLPTYNRVHLDADPQAFLVVLEGRSDPRVGDVPRIEVAPILEERAPNGSEWHGRGG